VHAPKTATSKKYHTKCLTRKKAHSWSSLGVTKTNIAFKQVNSYQPPNAKSCL